MPRPLLVDRLRQKCLQIPESVIVPVELLLFSEIEGRVPQGRLSELVTHLLREWLAAQKGA